MVWPPQYRAYEADCLKEEGKTAEILAMIRGESLQQKEPPCPYSLRGRPKSKKECTVFFKGAFGIISPCGRVL